jgi:CYTH domain-containing protein
MEFETEKEANNFQAPNWVIRDVTDDIRYKNASLTQF